MASIHFGVGLLELELDLLEKVGQFLPIVIVELHLLENEVLEFLHLVHLLAYFLHIHVFLDSGLCLLSHVVSEMHHVFVQVG